MRSAFRRELSRTGFQILGLLLGLLIVLLLGFLYGQRIENEVGDVATRQQRDHRHIVAIEKGHPLKQHSEGVVTTNGHAPSSQPSPPSHGGHQGHGGTPPHSGPHAPLPPQAPPAAAPAPAPSPQPPPGNSGNAPGHTKGPLAPVVEQVVPPAAAPTVGQVCEKAAAVTPVC